MSDYLAAEQVADARRWEVPGFAAPQQPVRAVHTAEELDAIAGAAREEGYAQGFAEGRTAGLAHADTLVTRVRGLCENFARPLAALDAEVEQALLQVVLVLAEHVLRQRLPQAPDAMVAFIREAVDLLQPSGRQVSVHLSPEDADALRELLQGDGQERGWRVLADRGLRAGDVQVHTDSGVLDGCLNTRLEALLHDLQVAEK